MDLIRTRSDAKFNMHWLISGKIRFKKLFQKNRIRMGKAPI